MTVDEKMAELVALLETLNEGVVQTVAREARVATAAAALLEQINLDENDGGLLSRETHRKAGALRLALAS